MSSLSIGVSGINATDNPGPGVAVALSLKSSSKSTKLIGLSYDVHDPGNYMIDLFDNSYLLPYPSKGWGGIKTTLKRIKEQDGLDVLVPCLDVEIPIMMKYQNELESMGVATLLPTPSQFELRSKDQLPDLVKKIGCLHPKTFIVSSIDELVQVLRTRAYLPVVVKGKYYKAYIVHNLESAVFRGSEIAAEWGFPLLVQEKVDGQEINLIGLSNINGEIMGHVSIKKQLTTQLGKVWTAVTIRDQKLDDLCKRFCKLTQWQGPFELECIINSNGIYLIEINPRFPAWVYFATGVGINLPDMLVKIIQGKDPEPVFEYPLGKYLVRYSTEFISDLSYFQNLLVAHNRNGL